jgi:FtsZ-binding cell division protein ZapB
MSDPAEAFAKLEEKIVRAAQIFKRAQVEKRELEQQLERLKSGSKERFRRSDAQERELVALRREREEIRSRIEKLLAQIDALTKSDSAG